MPFFEPGLEELVRRTADAGRLRFTTEYAEAIPDADFVFITVDTPPDEDGKADMSRVASASRSLAPHLRGRTIIINKSTMPVGSGDFVAQIIREHAPPDASFAVVSNPGVPARGLGGARYSGARPDRARRRRCRLP